MTKLANPTKRHFIELELCRRLGLSAELLKSVQINCTAGQPITAILEVVLTENQLDALLCLPPPEGS